MIHNTMEKTSQEISSLLDKSLFINKITDSLYNFLFLSNTSQTKKYLQYLGILMILKKSMDAARHLFKYLHSGLNYIQARTSFYPPQFKDRFGVKYWTLIFGADNELGRCFCRQLAVLGFDLILVGTNQSIMNQQLRQINCVNPYVKVKIIKVGLFYKNTIQTVQKEIQGLDVGLLINNCQFFIYQKYENIKRSSLTDCWHNNVNVLANVCELLVPRMKKRPFRSGIINITSCLGVIPSPYTGLYSAGACFTDILSKALSQELRGKVEVLSLRLFSVFRAEPKLFRKATNSGYVVSALKALGNQDVGYGSFFHQTYISKRLEECQTQAVRKLQKTVKETVPNEFKI